MTTQHAKTRAKRYSPRQRDAHRIPRPSPSTPTECLSCDAPTEDPQNEYCDACTAEFIRHGQ